VREEKKGRGPMRVHDVHRRSHDQGPHIRGPHIKKPLAREESFSRGRLGGGLAKFAGVLKTEVFKVQGVCEGKSLLAVEEGHRRGGLLASVEKVEGGYVVRQEGGGRRGCGGRGFSEARLRVGVRKVPEKRLSSGLMVERRPSHTKSGLIISRSSWPSLVMGVFGETVNYRGFPEKEPLRLGNLTWSSPKEVRG